MEIKWAIGIFLVPFAFSICSQQPIWQVRQLPVGSVVTTTGTISSGYEFGQVRYMQDSSAGIALYSADLDSTIPGDSIEVTGVLSRYRGELQISPVMSWQLIAGGRTVESQEARNVLDIQHPQFEARRFHMPCVGIATCEGKVEDGWYILFDPSGHAVRLQVSSDPEASGFSATTNAVSIEGIWTRFEDQYQLRLQNLSYTTEPPCFIVSNGYATFSGHTNLEPTIIWQGPFSTGRWVEYGKTEFSDTMVLAGDLSPIEIVVLHGLDSGSLYRARLAVLNPNGDTSFSIPTFFSAPSFSSPVEILFNRSVDASFSDGSHPLATGSSVIESDIIQRIDQVASTLDVAMYNTTRNSIVEAVGRAVQRGVQVRYIADDETSNSALEGVLSFPVLFRSGDGIMHHKFIVADAADADKAWVWTGSTNFSTNQLSSDPNHAYIIHDRALAQNYKREFDEMWGLLPNHADGHYGDFKVNNSAINFLAGGALMESYFSPSDETNCHILQALQSTNQHAEIGLLLLTRQDLVDEIIAKHEQGIEVRVIVEDEESSADALARLRQADVPVAVHDLSSIFHHKYAIIDEGFTGSDPQVVTGSHNWTWSADNINDENTLIIHSQSVANIFRQEFEARWKELVPTSGITILSGSIEIFPNPATSIVQVHNPTVAKGTVKLVDLFGRIVATYDLDAESTSSLDLEPNLINGVYLLQVDLSGQQSTTRLLICR